MNSMSMEGEERNFHDPMLRSNSYGKVRSRYLKEPTGSCHDLCKYGRKHDSNNVEKRLTFRKFIANRTALKAVHSLEKDPVVADRKKKLVIKMTSDIGKFAEQSIQPQKDDIVTISSKLESDICYSQFILPEDSNTFFKAPSPTHKSTESVMDITAQANDDENDSPQISAIVIADKNTSNGLGVLLDETKDSGFSQQFIKSKPLDDEIVHVKVPNCSTNKKHENKLTASSLVTKSTPAKSNILNQKSSSASTENSRGDTNFIKEKVLSNLKESTLTKRLKVIKQNSTISGKQSMPPKLQSSNLNVFLSHRKTKVFAKPASSVTTRSSLNASRCLNGLTNPQRNSNGGFSKVGKMKSLRSLTATISSREPVLSVKNLNERKSRHVKHETLKKSGKYKNEYGHIHEKIMEVIEPKSGGKTLGLNQKLSKVSDGHASESAFSKVSDDSLNKRNQRKYRCSSSKGEEHRWPRRTPAVPPADNSSSTYKLKFKRGKVIELRSAESVGPRRLSFRRVKVLGENPSDDVVKRSSGRKRDIVEFNDSKSGSPDFKLKKANSEPEGVKLKHQDSQVKKDMQSLFNHVIEETASKLVEIRKSKVKALVGAFESVILLQETKLASTV